MARTSGGSSGFDGDFSGTSGISLTDDSTTGINIEETGPGPVSVSADNNQLTLSAGETATLAGAEGVNITSEGGALAVGLSADLIALYGATAVAQPAAIDQVATTPAALTSYGFTEAQANYIVAAINDILNVLGAAAGGIGITA